MAKRRTIEEDVTTLITKVKESRAKSDNPEGCANIRALRKRLKRAQRKIRLAKREEERLKGKEAPAEG